MTTDLRVWVAEGDAERVQPVHTTGMTGADAEAYARTLLVEEFRDRKLCDADLSPDTPITATLCAAAEHYARQDHDFVFLRDMGMALTQWGSLTTGQARGVLNCLRAQALRDEPPPPIGFTADGNEIAAVFPQIRALFDKLAEELVQPTLRTASLRLKYAGTRSKTPGAIFVMADGDYLGKVDVDGNADVRLRRADPRLLDELVELDRDPVGYTAREGKRLGRCCFCNKGLVEAGSLAAGYGPVCAERLGFPHSQNGTAPKPPPTPVIATADVLSS